MAWPVLPTLGSVVNAASGVLFVGLGAFVAWHRPRRKPNFAFAVFSINLGIVFVLSNLVREDHPWDAPLATASMVLSVPAALAVAALAYWTPARPRAPMRVLVLPVLAALVSFGSVAVTWAAGGTFNRQYSILLAGFLFALVLLAIQYRNIEAPDAGQVALIAAALTLFPAIAVGFTLDADNLVSLAHVALFVALTSIWLTTGRRGGPAAARHGRNLALLGPACILAGYLAQVLAGGEVRADWDWGVPGIARSLTVLVLAYGILRHQLLGIDVKVKWTIKQSTLAGLFIAVFFIVSELSAKLLSDRAGPIVGILATGALVFALTPLQRFATGVADRTMPRAMPVPTMPAADRHRVYLEAAREAWMDNQLSRDERNLLDRLRESLEIAPADAARLEKNAMKTSTTTQRRAPQLGTR